VKLVDIEIGWKDGLPEDELEQAQIAHWNKKIKIQ